MSDQESDGIDETLQGVTQVAMTTAARMGEQFARAREQQARDAQSQSEQAAREVGARFTAELEGARASLAPVHRNEWWDSASARDVTTAYETASAWKDVDPEAMRAEQRIVDQVRTRYGVDIGQGTDSATVTEAVERGEQARATSDEERAEGRGDRSEAAALMAQADGIDQAADDQVRDQTEADETDLEGRVAAEGEHERADEGREDAGHFYDSAERREAMARGLDHVENKAAVDARVLSDVAQARPATEAVASGPGKSPKARTSRGGAQTTRTAQRPGLSR